MKSIHRFTTRIGMMFLVFVVAAVTAHSKPGGHRTAISECRATFQFAPTYAKVVGAEPLQLYLGTTGYASFDGVPIYGPYDVREALSSRAVSMQWEVNNCFAGNRPDLGLIRAIGKTKPHADERSTTVFVADNDAHGL